MDTSAPSPGGLFAIILDHHTAVRAGLQALLEDKTTLAYPDAGDATRSVAAPELIVVDPSQYQGSAERLVLTLHRQFYPAQILFYVARDLDYFCELATRLGIAGVLPKSADPQTTIATIHAAAVGWQVGVMAKPPRDARNLSVHARFDYSRLSTRELAVLDKLQQGMRNKAVADALNLSEKTVSAHKANILRKLGAASLIELFHTT